jgi:hypothetical protein
MGVVAIEDYLDETRYRAAPLARQLSGKNWF